jgi:hypothetical protein
VSRNSQGRKDWDQDYDVGARKKQPPRREIKDWLDDEQMYQKRLNHRNKKKRLDY